MAVSATFLADMSSFDRAMQKSELKVADLRAETDRASRQLTRMQDSFSGKKIFADAELAAKAIKGIEGASTLTSREQLKLNGIMVEALAKYKALGQEAPAHLAAIAKATTPINTGFTSMLGLVKQIGPALGISFGVGAVVGLAKEVGSFAGQIIDLNAQTQISTTRLQAFNFAGAGAGLTLENITTSADQLAKRLGGDDDSVNAALAKLNLSGQDLKQLGLDEVMFRVDEALVGVGNQFDRARILADLFGKSGAQLGRLMDGSLREVIKAAEDSGAIIDEELLKKADEFDDAWSQAWIKFRAMATDSIGFVGGLLDGLRDVAKHGIRFEGGGDFSEFQRNTKRLAPGDAIVGGRVVPGGNVMSGSNTITGGGLPEVDKVAASLREWSEANNKAAAATLSWARNLEGEARFDQDAKFFHAAISDATKTLQKLTMIAGVPGVMASSNMRTDLLMTATPGKVDGGAVPMYTVLKQVEQSWGSLGESMTRSLQEIERVSSGVFGDIANDILNVIGAVQMGGRAGERIKGGLTQGGFAGAADVALGGFEAASAIDAATAEGSRGKRVLGGAATGAKIGTMILPGIGTAIGAGVGALVGVFRGKSKGEKLNDTRDAELSRLTGFSGKGESQARFREMAIEAGVASKEIDKLFSTHRTQEFDSALSAITGKLTQFTGEQEADAARLTAAIEKYGFSFDQLGPKFQQQELDESAKELIEDWRVLVASGIEIGTVNEKMATSINDYLQTALKVGAEVPSAMRPILQKMLEQGTLTDDAGTAITDLEKSGIKFSKTMTEGFEGVIKKLDELILKLVAAGKLFDDVEVPTTEVPQAGQGTGLSEQTPVYPQARGGRGRVNRPTLFLAGEAGPEDFAFSGANRRLGGGGDGWSVVAGKLDELTQQMQRDRRRLPLDLVSAILTRGGR